MQRNTNLLCDEEKLGSVVKGWRTKMQWKWLRDSGTFELLKCKNGKSVPNKRLKPFILPSQLFINEATIQIRSIHASNDSDQTHLIPKHQDQTNDNVKLWEQKLRHSQSTRYSSTTIAFIRGISKPKVMSPQSHPRAMGIKCWMTNDQLPDEGIFSHLYKIDGHMYDKHISYELNGSSHINCRAYSGF